MIGAGYVAREFAMFGKDLADRVALQTDGIEVIEKAWSGEPFEYRGSTITVTPRPYRRPRPPIVLGGSSAGAARREHASPTASKRPCRNSRPSMRRSAPGSAAPGHLREDRRCPACFFTSLWTPTPHGSRSPPTPCTRPTPTGSGFPKRALRLLTTASMTRRPSRLRPLPGAHPRRAPQPGFGARARSDDRLPPPHGRTRSRDRVVELAVVRVAGPAGPA